MEREMPQQNSSPRDGQDDGMPCRTYSPPTPPPPLLTYQRPWRSSPVQILVMEALQEEVQQVGAVEVLKGAKNSLRVLNTPSTFRVLKWPHVILPRMLENRVGVRETQPLAKSLWQLSHHLKR